MCKNYRRCLLVLLFVRTIDSFVLSSDSLQIQKKKKCLKYSFTSLKCCTVFDDDLHATDWFNYSISLHLAMSPPSLRLSLVALSFSFCTREKTALISFFFFFNGNKIRFERFQNTWFPFFESTRFYQEFILVYMNGLSLVRCSRCYHLEYNFISETKFALNFTLYTLTHFFFRWWSRLVICALAWPRLYGLLLLASSPSSCFIFLFYSFELFGFFLLRCGTPNDPTSVPRVLCIFFFYFSRCICGEWVSEWGVAFW